MTKREGLLKTQILLNTYVQMIQYLENFDLKDFILYSQNQGVEVSHDKIAEIGASTIVLSSQLKKTLPELYSGIGQLMQEHNIPVVDDWDISLAEKLMNPLDSTKMRATFVSIGFLCFHNFNAITLIPIMVRKREIKGLMESYYRDLIDTLENYPDVLGLLMPYLYRKN